MYASFIAIATISFGMVALYVFYQRPGKIFIGESSYGSFAKRESLRPAAPASRAVKRAPRAASRVKSRRPCRSFITMAAAWKIGERCPIESSYWLKLLPHWANSCLSSLSNSIPSINTQGEFLSRAHAFEAEAFRASIIK